MILLDDLWGEIRLAAVNSNLKEMVQILYLSDFLTGLEARIMKNYSYISEEDIAMFITSAIESLYIKLSNEDYVANPGGYLYTVVKFKLHEFIKKQKRITDGLRNKQLVESAYEKGLGQQEELDDEYCLKLAIREARRLIPKLGQENIQKVMGYVLDCLEVQKFDIRPIEIAEILGMNPNTVRTNLKRGYERLERAALEASSAERLLSELQLLSEMEEEEGKI